MNSKKYTVKGLSREFVKEIHILAVSKGLLEDAIAISKISSIIYLEDVEDDRLFLESFSSGDKVEIKIKGDPRNSPQELTIKKITEDAHDGAIKRTRVDFSDYSWCWLDNFKPNWIKKINS